MSAIEFRVTDKEGAYLCAAQALIFEGSILAYNPARDEVEWVPACGVTNNLSWAKERSAVALANFVPRIPQEVDRIMELRGRRLLGWSNNSSSEEEDDEQMQEEDGELEGDEPEGDEHEEAEGWGEADPESPSSSVVLEQGKTELEVKPQGRQRSWEWGSIMDNGEPLTFDNP